MKILVACEEIRPFEEYKEMIKDMGKEEMIRGLYDLSARVTKQENIIKEVREYIINHREAVDERAEHIIYFLKDDFDEEDILKILDDEKV